VRARAANADVFHAGKKGRGLVPPK
jgi:hypothetical protein